MSHSPIFLDDGYAGAQMPFHPVPVEVDGNLYKLQCAAPGQQYLYAWKHKSDVDRARTTNTAQ